MMNPYKKIRCGQLRKVLAYVLIASSGALAFGEQAAWTKSLPELMLVGGLSGHACLGTPMEKQFMLMPAHCIGSEQGVSQVKNENPGRDYTFSQEISLTKANRVELKSFMIAKRRHNIGERVWIQRYSGWEAARIEMVTGASYWLRSESVAFCPGDSGATAWASENGVPVWIAMVVSGEGLQGCSARATAVSSQSIDWPWAR